MRTFVDWLVVIVAALVASGVVLIIIDIVLRVLRLRWSGLWTAWQGLRVPTAATLLTVALRIGIDRRIPENNSPAQHIVLICLIGASMWLIGAIVLRLLRLSGRELIDRKDDSRDKRRTLTQLKLINRLVTAALVVITVGMILLTFPGVQRVGAGLLASAGLVSIVIGVAAQSSLANVFAGLQIGFSESLRIDDVVVVEGEFGTVEDITLTYVVVRVWDERRLILPSSYFTSQPFTNWTRTGTQITGVVFFELDWRIDLEGMRARLAEILADSEFWDHRSSSLIVTDAMGGMLTVRVVVSAANSDAVFSLRCLVREQLVLWVRDHDPDGLPHSRVRIDGPRDTGTPTIAPGQP